MPNRKLLTLDEPNSGRLMVQYSPAGGEAIPENPPRFSWLPVVEDDAQYVLRVSSEPGYPAKSTRTFSCIKLNFFTPGEVLPAGDYYWSYTVCDPETGKPAKNWSVNRSFSVPPDLPESPLPDCKTRFADVDRSHPRLWMNSERLRHFREAIGTDPEYCTWSTFFEKSVLPWMESEIKEEPIGYLNQQRTASTWREIYIECQELIYAIRHLAIGGQVTENQAMLSRAKEWLLSAAAWNPAGTTSRSYTDEWAFRVNLALAWGYDWLYDQFSEAECEIVRTALLARTRETANHLIKHANIHVFPFDSHAVRAVSSVLIPASIALLEDVEEAEDWLNYAVEFLFTIYSPWGDADGGWAEGPHYWMTGMAYLIDAANLLKSYTGINLYLRPFFQKTGDFPLYTKAPDTRRATFGDDSTLGDLPAIKIGYNLRQLAGVTGNGAYQWYYDEIKRANPGTENASYNWGWWDFNFDELTYRTDFPIIEAVPPANDDQLRWFRGIGWVAIQHRIQDADNHIQFVMKSSPYGSVSHSHSDQNAFCLAAFGEDLAIQSGHYVAFNSSMHQHWRRQTRSKNAILINGKGQYSGKDKAQAVRASGQIIQAEDRGDHIFIRGDATAAYRSLTPEVTSVLRDIYFVNNEFFVIVDSIDSDEVVEIDWLLHANAPMSLGDATFRYTGEKAGFYGKFLWSEAGEASLTQDSGYPGVDPSEIEGLPQGICLKAKFPAAIRHRIATLLVPYPLSAPRRIFSFLDDQGYDCDLYFTDKEDRSFKVVVPKSFDLATSTKTERSQKKAK